MAETALQELTAAADALVASPSALADDTAQQFLQAHPLDEIFRILSQTSLDKHAADVIVGALGKVLNTHYGTSLLPAAVGYAEAALGSPEPRLRRLGAAQLGRLLLLQAAGTEQRQEAAGNLVAALEDPDTGVAAEAGAALSRFAASPASGGLALLLDGSMAAGSRLAQLADGGDATLRHRAYALLAEAVGRSGRAVDMLRESALATSLVSELDPSDPLSCLAALQLLQQLAESAGPATARLLCTLLLPHLGPLLADPDTAPGALPVAARLLGQAVAVESSGGVGGNGAAAAAAAAANGNGNGAAAMDLDFRSSLSDGERQLLVHIASLLDDSGDAGPPEEVSALDAASQLALTPAGAVLLATHPSAPTLLPSIASRALGRAGGGAPEVRVAALHALAAVAGGERAGEARDRGAALLPLMQAEDNLRAAVYGGAVGAEWAGSPAEAVLALLQQPFNDLRAGLYRCVAALSLRAWFAADVANTTALLNRLCDPRSESGQMCQWRHSAVMALLATAREVAAGAEGREGSSLASTHRSALASALGPLRAAAAAGPYGAAGAGGGAASHDHFVANRPR